MVEVNRIYNEDCLAGMNDIPDKSVDCIICDLPYGVLNKSKSRWDKQLPLPELWRQYERVIKDNGAILLFCQGMFTANLMLSNPKLWRYNLVWDKNRTSGFLNANRMPLRVHEDIAVFYKHLPTFHPQKTICAPNLKSHSRGNGGGKKNNNCYGNFNFIKKDYNENVKFPKSIIKIDKEHESVTYHPTQKPVDLIRYLIRSYTNIGDIVLDNCIGSGTTAIACIKEQRKFIGYETDTTFYKTALKRIANEVPQLPFAETINN